ncbi:MAG: hypothetical protein JW839_08695 [Candidatus Lokiarchaeota archaeon]|nr:hypothetical protein [Candidatus Lokiarchaeota archaeon]
MEPRTHRAEVLALGFGGFQLADFLRSYRDKAFFRFSGAREPGGMTLHPFTIQDQGISKEVRVTGIPVTAPVSVQERFARYMPRYDGIIAYIDARGGAPSKLLDTLVVLLMVAFPGNPGNDRLPSCLALVDAESIEVSELMLGGIELALSRVEGMSFRVEPICWESMERVVAVLDRYLISCIQTKEGSGAARGG